MSSKNRTRNEGKNLSKTPQTASVPELKTRSVHSQRSQYSSSSSFQPQQSTDIFIPSVKSWVDLSPRTSISKDSRSIASTATLSAAYRNASNNKLEKLQHERAIEITPSGKVIINVPITIDNSQPKTPTRADLVHSPAPDPRVFDLHAAKAPPVHRASGEVSVSVVTTNSTTPPRRRKRYSNNRASLWGDDENTLEALEEARLEAERLQKLEEEAKRAELERQKEEREMMLKLKVMNTLFDKKITTSEAPMRHRLLKAILASEHHGDESDDQLGELPSEREGKNEDGRSHRKTELFKQAVQAYLPKFRSKDWRQERIREGTALSHEEKVIVVKEIKDSIGDFADSHMKTKLKDLATFVNQHTSRKVINCWNMIEGRFKNSPHYKTVLTPDPHGLMHPVKHPSLYLSSIVSLLCSSRIKVGHQEITAILQEFGSADRDILLARRIAAYNAIIQVSIETKSLLTESYKAQVSELMKDETALISLHELTDLIFDRDPQKRDDQLAFVKGNRQNEANKMLEEKRRKDDLKEQLERRRMKLIEDFEKLLEAMQFYKGIMTQNRIDAFHYLIKHCQKLIDEHRADQSSRVPIDVVTFIGIEAFPEPIKQMIIARMHKSTRRQAKMLDANQVKKAVKAVEEKKKKEQEEEHQRKERRAKERLERAAARETNISLDSAVTGSLMTDDNTNSVEQNESYDSNDDSSLRHRSSIDVGETAKNPQDFARSKSQILAEDEEGGEEDEEEESYEAKVLQLLLSDQSMDVGNVSRVKLSGPPVAMTAMRELVALGKTFPGFSYRDAVEVFQYIGATKVAAFLRCRHRSWRYNAAKRKWTAIFMAIKKKFYSIWAEFTSYNIQLRRYCLRKIIAWKYFVKRAKERRETFRICFWPFYVWRKEAGKTATAKEKTKFLVGRVMPTVLMLKVFHAWKKEALFEAKCNKISKVHYSQYLHKRLILSFKNWSFFAYQHRFLRRAWFRRGLNMMRNNLRSRLRTTFYLWKLYVQFRKYVRGRMKTEFFAFKQRLFRYRKPWKRLSFADKRMRASAKRKASIEALRKEALKQQKKRKSMVVGQAARRISISDDRSLSSNDSSSTLNIAEKLQEAMETTRDPLNALNALAAERTLPIAQIKHETKVKKKNKNFNWKEDQRNYFDVDSDGEDDIDLPPLLINLYNEQLRNIVHKVPRRYSQVKNTMSSFAEQVSEKDNGKNEEKPPQISTTTDKLAADQIKPRAGSPLSQFSAQQKVMHNLPPFPRDISEEVTVNRIKEGYFYHPEYLEDKVESLTRGYQYRDIWNLFESAFRWHHFAYVAFMNLRHNAKIKKRIRLYKRQKAFFLISFYFQEWKIFLRNNLAMIAQNTDGDGNVIEDVRSKKSSINLYHNLRSHLLQKTIKLRKLNEEIRKYYRNYYSERGMESDDEYDDEKRARRKIRQLNQLDMGEKSWDEDEEDEEMSNANKFKNYRLKKAATAALIPKPQSAKRMPKPNPLAILDFDTILNSNVSTAGAPAPSGGGGHAMFHRPSIVAQTTGNGATTANSEYPQPPAHINNLFEWDNYNRDLEIKFTEDMAKYSYRVKDMVKYVIEKSSIEHNSIIVIREQLSEMIQEIFKYEENITVKAILKQKEYSEIFKIHAANYLLMKLTKVYYEVQYSLIKEETKKFFRRLRLPMAYKRSLRLYRRKKLQNYIRLCRRLQYINKHAAYYYQIRIKYINFMKWIRYLEKVKLNPTPNLMQMIRRRLLLHPDFHLALLKKGFGNLSDKNLYENTKLQDTVSDFQMIFKRWKMYTQESILFRLMHERVHKLYLFKLLLKSFVVLKNSSINSSNYLEYMEENYPEDTSTCFTIIRLKADLAQLSKRFIPLRRKQLPVRIKKNNQKISHQMKIMGKHSLTYKKFLTDFQLIVMQRINTEQRLLFEAFEARGKQEFIDVQYPFSKDDPIIPPLMSKIEGRNFRDPHLPANLLTPNTPGMSSRGDARAHSALRESNIPGGFRLHKVKFAMIIHNLQISGGGDNTGSSSAPSSQLMGWQFVWNGEGIREIESTPRGTFNAAGISVQEITIPKDDFVIGVEYLYDGPTIVSIRLKLLQNGFTRWIGGKASLSTLSLYLDVTMSPPEEFESDRQLYDDEIRKPALPFRYVVGFSGVMYNGRPTCLGLMIRKIRYQHIFSYTWVYDVILHKRFMSKNSDQPAVAVTKGVMAPISIGDGVGSIPSEIKYIDNGQRKNGGEEFNDESLTLSKNDSQDFMGGQGDNDTDSYDREGESEENSIVSIEPADEMLKKGQQLEQNSDEEATQKSADIGNESHDDESYADSANGSQVSSPMGGDPGVVKGGKGSEMKRKHALKRFMQWTKNRGSDEPLTVSETQFFDVLRMRLTELTVAKTRAEEFSRRIWTSKDFRFDPELSKLLSLPIIAALTRWLFNALSKKLGKVCVTEQRGLQYLKSSRKYISALKTVQRRKTRTVLELKTMENTPQPWQNKHMLGPLERQQKKEYQGKLQELRSQIASFDQEIDEMKRKSAEFERKGRLLLPRIALSLPVYQNFKVKLAAARHKQNLLENMTLDEIKNGLFGSNMKETLLNKDQMEAIHASLKDRKIVMKDTTSLQRLVDNILVQEEEHFRNDQYVKQHTNYLQQQLTGAGRGGAARGIAGDIRRPQSIVQYSKTQPMQSPPPRLQSPMSRTATTSAAIENVGVNLAKKLTATTTRSQPASSKKAPVRSQSTTTKLPKIDKRFQPTQVISQSVEKLQIEKLQRKLSSSSHILMTNDNSPVGSLDEYHDLDYPRKSSEVGKKGKKEGKMNINLTIGAMHDDIDESTTASNAISEISFGSPKYRAHKSKEKDIHQKK